MRAGGFASEAQLVRDGRRLLRAALGEIEGPVRTRYEVPAPGSVPDAIIFKSEGHEVRYVVSVEFKLRDWRGALHQAFRHRNFVNEAYVVLDQVWAAPALANVLLFERANVGLAMVDRNEGISVAHFPRPGLPFSYDYARSFARNLLAPNRTLRMGLPFTRTVRGGVSLAGLRSAWNETIEASR